MTDQVRILCVDDEKNVLRALERVFMDEDYEIVIANSAEEGLTALENGLNPQVVISDYRMPGINGVEFLREVCKKWPETVRIVLSGFADTAAVVAAINEGEIYKFIPKPWNDDELKVTIGNAIDRYTLHKRNIELTDALRQSNDELERQNELLEEAVAQRTADLLLRNNALTLAHNTLNVLPVAVIGVDPEGMVVQCNKAAATLFGVDAGEAIGRQASEILPHIADCLENKVSRAAISVGDKNFQLLAATLDQESQYGTVLAVIPEV